MYSFLLLSLPCRLPPPEVLPGELIRTTAIDEKLRYEQELQAAVEQVRPRGKGRLGCG